MFLLGRPFIPFVPKFNSNLLVICFEKLIMKN